MSLSEKDMLLLDCFMYSDIAPYAEKDAALSDIIDAYRDPSTGEVSAKLLKQNGIKCSGDMNFDKLAEVMNEMSASKDLMDLRITHKTEEYEGSIRAACFVDSNGEATVAFRGTGGSYQQWYNNFEGYGDESQATQEAAAEFINSLPYDGIDVTGHSNGGDQAMYVTIVCADKVDRCVSYEGQGMSVEFAAKYADEIRKNKHKIKNICGKKDFVSPLLINIAGETVYVNSSAGLLGGVFSHGAYGIWDANRDNFDENGNFLDSAYVNQAPWCTAIHVLTLWLSAHSNTPFVGPALELLSDFAGIVVGLIISGDWKDPEMLLKAAAALIEAIKDFAIETIKDIIGGIQYIADKVAKWLNKVVNAKAIKYANDHPQIKVDTYKLTTYAGRLQAVNRRLVNLDRRLDALYWKVGLLDLWKLLSADILTGYSGRLLLCSSYLNDTAKEFDACEKIISNSI